MASGYEYGSYQSVSGYGFEFRSFFHYSTSETSTTYTITVYSGAQIRYNSGTVQMKLTCALSGTGQDSRSTTKTFDTGDCDSSKRMTMLSSKSWTWSKGTSSSSKTITNKISKSGMTTSTASKSFTVPALASYSVSYNLNGGSGSISNQTKYYGKALTLSSTVPTKTGYNFGGWKGSNGSTYSSGSSYTGNAALTLTAIWNAKTSTVSYNANGGSGTIATQTKTYGKSLTLSNGSGFTRTNYKLVNWKINNGSSTYSLSEALNANTIYSNMTLYANWELTYIKPVISSPKAFRTATSTSTTASDDGEYIRVSFNYTGGNMGGSTVSPHCKITIDGIEEQDTLLISGTGTYYSNYGTYSADTSHTVVIKLYDSNDTTGTTYTITVPTAKYPLDLVSNGNNVYMGVMTPAESGIDLTLAGFNTRGTINLQNGKQIYLSTTATNKPNIHSGETSTYGDCIYYRTGNDDTTTNNHYHAFYAGNNAVAYLKSDAVSFGTSSNNIPMTVYGDVNITGSYKMSGSNLLKVVATTKDNISIAKATTGSDTFTVSSQTGYTPVGIVGFDLSNASSSGTGVGSVVPLQIQLSGSTVSWQIRNNHSSTAAKISLQVFVLYAKTGLI